MSVPPHQGSFVTNLYPERARMPLARWIALPIAGLFCALHAPLVAQKIECVVPADPGNINQRCSFAAPAGDQTKALVVRLTPSGTTERWVHFSLSPGASGTVTDSALT